MHLHPASLPAGSIPHPPLSFFFGVHRSCPSITRQLRGDAVTSAFFSSLGLLLFLYFMALAPFFAAGPLVDPATTAAAVGYTVNQLSQAASSDFGRSSIAALGDALGSGFRTLLDHGRMISDPVPLYAPDGNITRFIRRAPVYVSNAGTSSSRASTLPFLRFSFRRSRGSWLPRRPYAPLPSLPIAHYSGYGTSRIPRVYRRVMPHWRGRYRAIFRRGRRTTYRPLTTLRFARGKRPRWS